jgi:hypothetical protein
MTAGAGKNSFTLSSSAFRFLGNIIIYLLILTNLQIVFSAKTLGLIFWRLQRIIRKFRAKPYL